MVYLAINGVFESREHNSNTSLATRKQSLSKAADSAGLLGQAALVARSSERSTEQQLSRQTIDSQRIQARIVRSLKTMTSGEMVEKIRGF